LRRYSRQHDAEVQFYAFDILAEGGEDLRTGCAHFAEGDFGRARE
jgi:hypothetical protein